MLTGDGQPDSSILNMKLENKVAVVTGASSGIGLAIANTFYSEGATVVYSDINQNNLIPDDRNAVFVKCDVSKKEDIDNLIDFTVEKFGKIDIMVNNAGIEIFGDILNINYESWDKAIAVNLSGVFYGDRAAALSMKNKGIKGSVINISSILGNVGLAGEIAYCTAKGGIVQLTRAASLDLAPFGIRINAIAPGVIRTKMTDRDLMDKSIIKRIEESTPLGYVGEPQDIANAALYLAGDDSKYVTGTIIYVDGGWTAR